MAKRRKGNREKEKETTWQERVIQIRRVSKVVKGGKKLSFRAIVVVGNENGQVGVGVGKMLSGPSVKAWPMAKNN